MKVGAYQIKIPKIVLRACFASRRNERGLDINEETGVPVPMEVRSRQDANSVCIKRQHGAMSAGEVLEEELCLLPEGCRIDWSAWSRARRKTKKRRAISRFGGVV